MTTDMNGKILVIDDEIGPRESLRILLKTQYEIVTADRVDAGLAKLEEHEFDLVIMDIRMPGKTGIEGLREIRAINPSISIIMLTGYGALETAQEAIRLGANDYLKKPFDVHEIQAIVGKNVERTRLEKRKALADKQIDELSERLNFTLKKRDIMTEMGMASSEMVHDLRNPLTVLRGYVELMKMEMKQINSTPELKYYLDQIESQIKRCAELAEDWYNLAKGTPDNMIEVNLAKMISDLARGTNQTNPEIEIHIPACPEDESVTVFANDLQIYRVFQNIIGNAVQALRNRDQKKISVRFVRDGNMITTTVIDTGCGINPEHIQWVFDPLSSFREGPKKGLGLGLFITKKIIENHNGTITMDSPLGQETTVTITLPAAIENKGNTI
jgi:signal transduction histidine kinase